MGLTPVMSDTVEPAPGLGAVQVAAASHIGQRAEQWGSSGGGVGVGCGGDGISSERHLLSALCPLCSYANVITYSRRVQRSRPRTRRRPGAPLPMAPCPPASGVAAAGNQSGGLGREGAVLPRAIDSFDGEGFFPSFVQQLGVEIPPIFLLSLSLSPLIYTIHGDGKDFGHVCAVSKSVATVCCFTFRLQVSTQWHWPAARRRRRTRRRGKKF